MAATSGYRLAPRCWYASRPELGSPELFKGPVASARATFLGWTPADRRTGRHPEHDAVRPVSTGDDSPFMGFWEVAGLHRMPAAVALARLRHLATGKPVKSAPLGPTLVDWDQALSPLAPGRTAGLS